MMFGFGKAAPEPEPQRVPDSLKMQVRARILAAPTPVLDAVFFANAQHIAHYGYAEWGESQDDVDSFLHLCHLAGDLLDAPVRDTTDGPPA